MFWRRSAPLSFFFFFNDTATTEIYTLSLHDALPICQHQVAGVGLAHGHAIAVAGHACDEVEVIDLVVHLHERSEEHTSELQSHLNLVCRLLLEKKKIQHPAPHHAARMASTNEPDNLR